MVAKNVTSRIKTVKKRGISKCMHNITLYSRDYKINKSLIGLLVINSCYYGILFQIIYCIMSNVVHSHKPYGNDSVVCVWLGIKENKHKIRWTILYSYQEQSISLS